MSTDTKLYNQQQRTLNKFIKGTGITAEFQCPQCGTDQNIPAVENPCEEMTQIRCKYGCGFVFLEDYLPYYFKL